MNYLLSQAEIPAGDLRGEGPLGLEGASGATGIAVFNKVISTAIAVLTIVAFLWFTFVLITGAIAVISSGGDKQKAAEARSRITMGLVGVVIVIASVFILQLIGSIIGIDFLRGAFFIPELAP